MLISFIIMPFYPNVNPEPPRETPPFLSFVMLWDIRGTDIDFYVREEIPGQEPRQYTFNRHNRDGQHYPQSNAQLSVDVTKGPGVEIWETPRFNAGATYTFAYHFYSRGNHDGDVAVEGRLYHGEGYHVVAPRQMGFRANAPATPVIRVTINDEQRVEARTVDDFRSPPGDTRL